MVKAETQDTTSTKQEPFPITIKTKAGLTIFIIFLTVIAIEAIGFVLVRLSIAQALGEILIAIDLGSVIVLFIGALTLTYLYYTRYVQREIILGQNNFSLKVGKRLFEYKWNEFSLVALSIATATVGIKGFSIRIYEDDLEGEYVELPIYRFPKQTQKLIFSDPSTIIDSAGKIMSVFDLRKKISDKVRSIQAQQENLKSHQKS